jgi:hypothetical protein
MKSTGSKTMVPIKSAFDSRPVTNKHMIVKKPTGEAGDNLTNEDITDTV